MAFQNATEILDKVQRSNHELLMAFANLSPKDKLKYYDRVNACLSKTESIIKKATDDELRAIPD